MSIFGVTARIWLTGCDGSHWDLSGPDMGKQGVELARKPQQFIDAPAKTFWVTTNSGTHYQQWKPDQRRPLFSCNIMGDDPYEWHDIDSRFRMALGMYDDTFTLHVATDEDGERTLICRLMEHPKSYEAFEWEGVDPHLYATSTMVISAACEQPFWEGDTVTGSWSLASGTTGLGYVTVENKGDVEAWPRWTVTAPVNNIAWLLPDWSWGNDYFGRASVDLARFVPLPLLLVGEDLDVLTDPAAVEPWVAANNSPVIYRSRGRQHIYPLPAHMAPTQVPLSVAGAVAGATAAVSIPQRYSRPWGVRTR